MAGTVADDLVPFSIPVLFKLILLLTLGALLYQNETNSLVSDHIFTQTFLYKMCNLSI